jgi:hypothetical protein
VNIRLSRVFLREGGRCVIITALVLMAISLLTGGCRGTSLSDEAASEIALALEETNEASMNGDVDKLEELVSDECRKKAELLETAAAWSSYSDWEVDFEIGADSLQFTGGDGYVVVRPDPDGPVPRLNGIPITEYDEDPNARVSFEFEFVDEGGTWRLLDCDDQNLDIEF